MVITAHAGSIEDGAYLVLEKGIVASGKSEDQAKCIVIVLRVFGATEDVTDLRNLFEPSELAQKLKEKAEAAEYLCTYGIASLFVVALVLLFTCCLCCCLCCKSTTKPSVVYIAMPQNPNKKGSVV
jgi:hypothetical protein